jgi:hypothetical protein
MNHLCKVVGSVSSLRDRINVDESAEDWQRCNYLIRPAVDHRGGLIIQAVTNTLSEIVHGVGQMPAPRGRAGITVVKVLRLAVAAMILIMIETEQFEEVANRRAVERDIRIVVVGDRIREVVPAPGR